MFSQYRGPCWPLYPNWYISKVSLSSYFIFFTMHFLVWNYLFFSFFFSIYSLNVISIFHNVRSWKSHFNWLIHCGIIVHRHSCLIYNPTFELTTVVFHLDYTLKLTRVFKTFIPRLNFRPTKSESELGRPGTSIFYSFPSIFKSS